MKWRMHWDKEQEEQEEEDEEGSGQEKRGEEIDLLLPQHC